MTRQSPGREIIVSLPQSANQGYPAMILSPSPLVTTKASAARASLAPSSPRNGSPPVRSLPLIAILERRLSSSLLHRGTSSIADLSVARIMVQARSEEHTSELQSRGHLVCR